MERAQRILYRLAIGCAVVGLAVLGGVILSGKAWPDPAFAIGAPVGLGLVALCLVCLAALWALRFGGAVRRGQLWQAAALVAVAIACLAGFFLRR